MIHRSGAGNSHHGTQYFFISGSNVTCGTI